MRTRTLLSCGVAAGPVFTAIFSAAGRNRHDYSPRRDAVSSLVHGRFGWVQVLNFFLTGGLICASAVGTRRMLRPVPGSAALPAVQVAAGLGLVFAGVFATDPPEVGGERMPLRVDRLSRTGALHVASAVPVFLAAPVACLMSFRFLREPGDAAWLTYCGATAAGSLGSAYLAGKGFSATEGRWVERAGTFQRIAAGSGLLWLSVFAARLLRAEARRKEPTMNPQLPAVGA